MNTGLVDTADPLWGPPCWQWGHCSHPCGDCTDSRQSVTIRECFWVSFMVMYTSSDTAMHAVTYQ